ncbi:MAG: cyclase [Rhodospirillaceae bacterium]|nr:cyclase [Rhodospirillaceae bacterium]
MTRRIIDLTFTIHEGMQTFPVHWQPAVEITQLGRHGQEDRETRKIVIGTHTGTHMDAPSHFIPGGETVENIPLDQLIGPATILDFTWAEEKQELGIDDLKKAIGDSPMERLVFRFDWSDHYGTLKYYQEHPFISEDAAQWLVDRGCRVVAMDSPQLDAPYNGRGSGNDSPCHKILLGNGCVKVEYLTNLKEIGQKEIELVVAPLKIAEGDGAPVRCFAIED